jgi:hypothetical protein
VTEYFRGGGFSSGFLTPGGMPMTMSRVNLVAGLGPVLQIAEGWTVDLPERVHETLNERTNPTWPTHWFVPRVEGRGPFRDVYTVMNNWGANHGSISFGHVGADLITLASMLRIPVFMHNVPEEDVFRPSAWTAFGAHDPQGADFRACAAFGPLYGPSACRRARRRSPGRALAEHPLPVVLVRAAVDPGDGALGHGDRPAGGVGAEENARGLDRHRRDVLGLGHARAEGHEAVVLQVEDPRPVAVLGDEVPDEAVDLAGERDAGVDVRHEDGRHAAHHDLVGEERLAERVGEGPRAGQRVDGGRVRVGDDVHAGDAQAHGVEQRLHGRVRGRPGVGLRPRERRAHGVVVERCRLEHLEHGVEPHAHEAVGAGRPQLRSARLHPERRGVGAGRRVALAQDRVVAGRVAEAVGQRDESVEDGVFHLRPPRRRPSSPRLRRRSP